jgi:hypothetical protein
MLVPVAIFVLIITFLPTKKEEPTPEVTDYSTHTDTVEEPKKPLEANSKITKFNNRELSEAMTDAYNVQYFLNTESFNLAAKPTYKVWIYNVSRQTFKVDHPVLRNVTIWGNETRKRYTMVTSLPNIVQMPLHNNDSWETTAVPIRGERLAMDLINPDNLGLDQNKGTDTIRPTGICRNLGEQGVFWSLNNPPKKEEVDAAVKRMETRYKNLLEKAEALEKSQIFKGMSEFITPELHAAADYFKVVTTWHSQFKG